MGRGSRFMVALPAGAGARPMAKRILVVEDDEKSRRLLIDVLGFHGFEVIAAESGERGLEAVGERLPDAALLDIQLPGISGFAVLEQLRGRPAAVAHSHPRGDRVGDGHRPRAHPRGGLRRLCTETR